PWGVIYALGTRKVSNSGASEVGDDFDRRLDHLARYEVEDPASRMREIVEAINVLESNPLIGRPTPSPRTPSPRTPSLRGA
ncbi:MAG TPA: hypothetical protein PLS93_19840, partial [Accumulibacter sp.]|nr:hypothetical protein [Accumulibacter sp.]